MLRDYCRVNEPGCRGESSVSGPEVGRDCGGAILLGGTEGGGDWQVVRPQLPPSTRLPHLKGGPAWWRCMARWWGGGLRSQHPGPGPAGQRPMMPLLPPPIPPLARVQSLTHHPILSGCVVPHHQHHWAAADTEEKGCLAWAGGGGGRGSLGGAGHSPERLGIGHCSGPVNVQVSAAAEREAE